MFLEACLPKVSWDFSSCVIQQASWAGFVLTLRAYSPLCSLLCLRDSSVDRAFLRFFSHMPVVISPLLADFLCAVTGHRRKERRRVSLSYPMNCELFPVRTVLILSFTFLTVKKKMETIVLGVFLPPSRKKF